LEALEATKKCQPPSQQSFKSTLRDLLEVVMIAIVGMVVVVSSSAVIMSSVVGFVGKLATLKGTVL